MILEKIRWMNLLSYGNYWTEIDFLKNDMTVIVGPNGVGKSTLLDALCFVLFGKAFRNINKPMLVNSITKKNLEVSVDLTTNGMNYRIIRGIKPAKFEVWWQPSISIKTGYARKDMTGVRDEQAALEEIIGCNFKSFTQVVCLGAAYTPFLKLEKADRRKIIENLLDLEIFSNMNVILKQEYSDVIDSIKGMEGKREVLREKRALLTDALYASEQAKQSRIEAWELDKKNIEAQRYSLWEENLLIKDLLTQEEVLSIKEEIKELNRKYEEWHRKNIECDQRLQLINKELQFYDEHESCPTCKQLLDPDFLGKIRSEKNYELNRFLEAKDKIKRSMDATHEMWTLKTYLHKKDHDNKVRLGSNNSRIEYFDQEISKINEKIIKETEAHEIVKQEVVDDIDRMITLTEQNIKDTFEEKSILTTLGKLLKDDGVKAVVINNYMEFINELINKYLIEMDLFVNLYLDGEFNETIKSRYRDEFKYDSFSEGQKMRIDLAILFAWREIAKQRNSLSVNLLIFDEVLSGSLDTEGIVDLIKILEGRFKENIFLITHDDRITSKFSNVISVIQESGFSIIYTESKKSDDE